MPRSRSRCKCGCGCFCILLLRCFVKVDGEENEIDDPMSQETPNGHYAGLLAQIYISNEVPGGWVISEFCRSVLDTRLHKWSVLLA